MVITLKSGGKGTPKTGKLDAYANVETGEIITTSFIRQMKVDDDQFAKLYVRKVSMLFDISKTGTRTLSYIIKCLRPDKDMIVFLMDDALAFTKYKTKKSPFEGLAELCRAGIIARGPADNLWFVNPLFAFFRQQSPVR